MSDENHPTSTIQPGNRHLICGCAPPPGNYSFQGHTHASHIDADSLSDWDGQKCLAIGMSRRVRDAYGRDILILFHERTEAIRDLNKKMMDRDRRKRNTHGRRNFRVMMGMP